MFRAYFYKMLRMPYLYIGIVGVVAVCSLRLLPSAYKGSDVAMEMEIIRYLDGYRKIFVILGALPFAANFSDEWNSMVITNCITRKNVRKYSAANVVMCFLSSLAVVFIGMMIFVGIYSTFHPFYLPDNDSIFPPYDVLAALGLPVLAEMAVTFVFAASCAMWAVMGLMMTAFFPSKYIAICAPFVFSYAVDRIAMLLPDELDLEALSLSHTELNALPAFLFANAVFAVIALICGIVFTIVVERRVRNGFN